MSYYLGIDIHYEKKVGNYLDCNKYNYICG